MSKVFEKVFKFEELESVVEEFLDYLTPPLLTKERSLVLGFSGNLGAGKTTFTKEFLKQLGHMGSVASPTFVLRRDYKTKDQKNVIHIDAYRLEKPEHIYQVISKQELADKNNLIIIEWPEKVYENNVGENIFDYIFLFEHVDENTRKITLLS